MLREEIKAKMINCYKNPVIRDQVYFVIVKKVISAFGKNNATKDEHLRGILTFLADEVNFDFSSTAFTQWESNPVIEGMISG